MSLRNKIILLITASVLLAAGLVAGFGSAMLTKALVWNFYAMEKERLENTSRAIITLTEKIISVQIPDKEAAAKKTVAKMFSKYSFLEEFSCAVQPGRHGVGVRLTAKRSASDLTFKIQRSKNTSPGARIYFSGDNRPKLLLSSTHPYKECIIDILKLWDSVKTVSANKSVFVTDATGRLLAHDDESRVTAKSDFSSLGVVRTFIAGAGITEPNISIDERGVESLGVFVPIGKIMAVFSLTPYETVISPATALLKRIFVYVAILLAGIIFLGIVFANKIVGPLKTLSDSAIKVASGNLDISIPEIKTRDEVGTLSKNFNYMTESLKKLGQLRDDLVHMIVHDLKSPLSAIISSLELMKAATGEDLAKKQKKYIHLSLTASKNLQRLIDDLLDVSKLEEGKLRLDRKKTAIKSLLEECVKPFTAQAESENKKIVLNCAEDLTADIDSPLIKRVMTNLLTNALKHTKNDIGRVEITAAAVDGGCAVTVSDNGVGIPEEYRDRIFEKFVQVEGKRSQIRSGTGLGLTFCKMVVEAHGGKIKVESVENVGSSFIFTIPNL